MKISVPEPLQRAGAGVAAGLLLSACDGYFGGGDARQGFSILSAGAGSVLAARFWARSGLLRRPRNPDFLFVAGADYAFRRRRVLSESYRMLKAAPLIAAPAWAVLSLVHSPPVPVAAGFAIGMLFLLLALAAAFRACVNREWIRPSSKPFMQSPALRPIHIPGTGNQFHLASTRSLAFFLAGLLPAGYRPLLARKLLYPLRADFGSILVWTLVLLTIGAACWWSGNPRLIGAFALISATAALTAYQLGTREADLFGRECPHYTWGEEASLRADMFVGAGLGLFFAAFSGIAQVAVAAGGGVPSEFFWKFTLAPLLPTLMAPLDNPARDWSDERRLYMNAGYLFVAAYLLLTPTWVMALLAAALLSFSWKKSRSPE